ncbi:MAG: hypothetical protein Q8K32_31220 [Archangium sp.]|nr:hypothetical protein [Archangium sp.]
MTQYVPPEKPWMLRLRSTVSFKAKLEAWVRLWRAHAKARGDATKPIDISYVVRNHIEEGISAAFDEYGGIPKDEEAWKAVEAAIAKGVKSSQSR